MPMRGQSDRIPKDTKPDLPPGVGTKPDTNDEQTVPATSDFPTTPGEKKDERSSDKQVVLSGIDFEELTGDTGKETFTNLLEQLNREAITTWVDFWELLMQKNMDKWEEGINRVKITVNSLLDVVQFTVDSLRFLVRISFAFAGFLLSSASTLMLMALILIRMLRQMLGMLDELLEIPLLKAETKFTYFNLWEKGYNFDIRQINRTGPIVNRIFTNMVNTWHNRPNVDDELCCMIFLPLSLPPEIANIIREGVRFKDLIYEHIRALKEFEFSELWDDYRWMQKPPSPGQTNGLISLMQEFIVISRSSISDDGSSGFIQNVFNDLVEKAVVIKSTGEYKNIMYDTLKGLIDLYNKTEFDIISSSSSGDKPTRGSVPGMMQYAARKVKRKDKAELQTNFFDGQYRFLSAIYKRNDQGEVSRIFRDPGLLLLKFLDHPDVTVWINVLCDVLYTVRRVFREAVYYGRMAKKQEQLESLLRDLCHHFLGQRNGDALLDRVSDPPRKLLELAIIGHAMEYQDTNKAPISEILGIKDTRDFLRKTSGIQYTSRTSVQSNFPLFSNSVEIDNVEAGDILTLVFDTADCMYLPMEFVERGVRAVSPVGAMNQNLFAGNIDAASNTVTLSVKVDLEEAEGLTPKWWGWGTPGQANSITGNKLMNLIMPDAVIETLEEFNTALDNAERTLREAMRFTDDLQDRLRAIEEEINRYFDIIDRIIRLLRQFIDALSLAQLPTVHLAIWRGSSKEIPNILSRALMEKNWFNSTYMGAILFMSGSAAVTVLEGYETTIRAERKLDNYARTMSRLKQELTEDNWDAVKQTAKDEHKKMSDSYEEAVDFKTRPEKEQRFTDAREPDFITIINEDPETAEEQISRALSTARMASVRRVVLDGVTADKTIISHGPEVEE